MNYEVSEISSNSDEIRIRARNINDEVYKDDLYDRAFAFKNVVIDEDYRLKRNEERKLKLKSNNI